MPATNAQAQLPFFTGQRTPTPYALENRAMFGKENPEVNNITILKTFRNELPLWAYFGNSYNNDNGLGNFFYGIGPMINLWDKVHMLATAEGSTEEFSGATIYSTLLLGRNWHIDLHPKFDGKLEYTSTSFNIGKTHKGLTYGISSDFTDRRFRSLRDIDIRVAKVKQGNFIDFGINFEKKRFRIAFQKAFGRRR